MDVDACGYLEFWVLCARRRDANSALFPFNHHFPLSQIRVFVASATGEVLRVLILGGFNKRNVNWRSRQQVYCFYRESTALLLNVQYRYTSGARWVRCLWGAREWLRVAPHIIIFRRTRLIAFRWREGPLARHEWIRPTRVKQEFLMADQ